MPAPATAGAISATHGVPVHEVAAAPAASTAAVAMTQPSSSDGVGKQRPGQARRAQHPPGQALQPPRLADRRPHVHRLSLGHQQPAHHSLERARQLDDRLRGLDLHDDLIDFHRSPRA